MHTKQSNLKLREVLNAKRTTPKPTKPFAAISDANARLVRESTESTNITANMDLIGAHTNTSSSALMETVTALLANIAMKAEQGQPIELMHINSVAAFLAGVEAMTAALPTATDETKRSNTLRVLTTAGLDGGQVNDATFPIVSLGAHKRERHKAFAQLLQAYVSSLTRGQPDGTAVARAAREIQMKVDRAMRMAVAQ